MRVLYVTYANGAKERKVFWNDAEGDAYALELARQGHEPADGETRDAIQRADVTSYADEHESGQLRLGVAGDQRELFPLADERIPGAAVELEPVGELVTVPAPIPGQTTI